jgi:hypothetical protein
MNDKAALTFDKDFGELARAAMGPKHAVSFWSSEAGRKIANMVMGRDDSAGHFSVIEPGGIRMQPPR